ncbi:MAG: MFS transporter [Burkholderiales bacterium]|nr:MFS transporter [Burkholderiales bacterium]
MAGNFAIGCGVMVTAGAMNDLVHSLQVSVSLGGQLITLGALVMGLGAPLLAALAGGSDRRRLLTFWLAWWGLGHLLSALVTDYFPLAVIRGFTVLGAAVFTPQAAAAMGVMAAPVDRGRAITFIFLGWSLSSVLGMPVHAYLAETLGWRYAFALVGLLSLVATAWVWWAMPNGVRPPALSLHQWRQALTSPMLMGIVGVTALAGAGQFTVMAYMAPYYRQVLHATAGEIGWLFMVFGAMAFVGNLLLTRGIDRIGPARAVLLSISCIALAMLLWPLAGSVLAMTFALLPWALGGFASNSAQQARLGLTAPALASALMALNSSAIYAGQAIGAAGGGAIIAAAGFAPLHWAALAWLLAAIALSQWAARQQRLAVVAHA